MRRRFKCHLYLRGVGASALSTATTTTRHPIFTSRRRLSTMSNLAKKLRQTAGGKEIGPSSCTTSRYHCVRKFTTLRLSAANKKRFVDATKSLLDIANESADAFPPLKSCLGGINALIKYYEVRLHRIANDLADISVSGMQRRRRQTRRTRSMAHEAQAQHGHIYRG